MSQRPRSKSLDILESDAKYRGLLEAAPDAMVVVDEAGAIVLLNVQAEKQLGYRRDELIGQPVANIIPWGSAERLMADGTRTAAEALARHIGTGIELSARRKNGSQFPVEIMISTLENREGILVIAAIRDISARKRAERRLAWTEMDAYASERLAAIVTSCDDAILSKTLDGIITSWNKSAERMFGYDAKEAIGQNGRLIIPSERQSEEIMILTEIRNGKSIDHHETERLTRDGLRVPVSISVSPLRDKTGHIVGAAKVMRDLSTRKKKDGELQAASEALALQHGALARSNAELEEFGYAVSHDLRAPLQAIDHLAEWIDEDIKGTATPETTENLALLRKRVKRMNMLITSLLDYCRNNQSNKVIEDVDVGGVVNDIVAMQGSPPNFFVLYEGQSLVFRTSRVALQVVLENLISNGIKHHDRTEGCISITARSLNEFVEFRVSDDGPGIPERFHERIFKIFQTLQSRDDLETSGIGLAMVKRKVETHGGRIWVECAPHGRGTTFAFTWRKSPDE